MPVIDLGKVVGDPGASMRFRGEWNSGSEYFNNASYVDTVTHHGSLWVCKQTNTGQEPIEGDYWGIGAYGTETGFDATITIPASGWVGVSAPFVQTVTVSGMTYNNAIVYAMQSENASPTDEEKAEYAKITGISQNTDNITFYADEKPTADIVIRAFNGAGTEDAADLSVIAAPFDSGKDYVEGEHCMNEGQMWKFDDAKSSGAWDPSKVTSTTVAKELEAHEVAISALNSSKKWELLGTAQGDGTGNGTSVNISSILDTASEIMLIINYQYNKSGSRANFSAHVVPQGAFKQTYTGGFYFSASNYACLGARITNENYAVIDGSWWHVQESASAVIPLNNDTATLYVYYR